MPYLSQRTGERMMSDYVVIVHDQVQAGLAGHDGISYESPPQSRERALAVASALIGVAQLPDDSCGSWRQAPPGGTRTVRLEPAP